MRIIKEEKKNLIILKDGDEIEVMTLKGNPIRIEIKCMDGTLLVDEISSNRIQELKIEQEQVKKMNQRK